MRAKRQIRSRMLALRTAIPETARAARSEAIVARVSSCPAWSVAKNVALYAPLLHRGEVDVHVLETEALRADRRVFYPCLDASGQPTFRRGSLTTLEERGAGYPEPPPDAEEATLGGLDAILVPALAVDESGRRIGYGSGFYDAALARFAPPAVSIVVAYHFQLLAELPGAEHDVRGDWVVTDAQAEKATAPLAGAGGAIF